VDLANIEPTEEEITFDEEEDKDEGVAEEEEWKEADCRVILNVSGNNNFY
jgi:hypothetical protein